LAGLIDWDRFATAFGSLYRKGVGRPGLPTRLMVGLHLIKHMDGLSDDAVCARFLDSPYVQLFCGETHFQHALSLDRSSMTRWRRRIGAERLEVLLAETLAAAQRAGAAEPKHFERVTVDTTVQPKAVTHPTDSKLIHRGVEILRRLARRHGVALRQSYARVSTHARREVAKLIHRGRHREAERKARDALEEVIDLAAFLDLRRPHRLAVREGGDLPDRSIPPDDSWWRYRPAAGGGPWASEITSLTPRRPRRVSERRVDALRRRARRSRPPRRRWPCRAPRAGHRC
jgi:hypothetical protein